MSPLLKSHGCCTVPAISAPLLLSAVWQVIDAVAQAISRTPGYVLLDVDAGASTNRTVYTFVGSPEAVVEGALSAARVAGQLIDMSRHSGELGGGPGAGLAQSIPAAGTKHGTGTGTVVTAPGLPEFKKCLQCSQAHGGILGAVLCRARTWT